MRRPPLFLGDVVQRHLPHGRYPRRRDIGPLQFTIWWVAIVAGLVLCALIGGR